MKIMSFNTQHCLNYVEGKIDFDIMARAIKACKADIVGLNEMYDNGIGDFDRQSGRLAELTGLNNCYFARAITEREGEYGNGFISRYPILKAETVIIPDPDPREYPNGYYETRCVLKAELENGYTVLVTHFGLNPDEQRNAVEAVLKHIKNEKCILILEIMSYNDKGLPDKILIQVVDSKDQSKIIRQGAGKGLYEAFNLGVIWLDHECRKDAE